MNVETSELCKLVLDAVADDYEEFDMVVNQVASWTNKPANGLEIEQALMKSISDGDVQAYEYSEPHFVAVGADSETIRSRWFYLTEQGKRRLLDSGVAISLTRDPIDAHQFVATAKCGEDGAVVVFDGIVRNNSRGRRTLHLDYEAYEEMAAKQMDELAREALTRFGVRHVAIVHRLGRLLVGETSVLIVVASAHRAQAYEASRWLIDTLKKTVPIWKKETFVDGAVWADGEPFPPGVGVEAADAS